MRLIKFKKDTLYFVLFDIRLRLMVDIKVMGTRGIYDNDFNIKQNKKKKITKCFCV